MKERPVGISLGNIGALHDGLGESSWQIGRRLVARTAADVCRHLGWTGQTTVIHKGARSFAGAPQQPGAGCNREPGRPFLFRLSRIMSPSKNPQALRGLAAEWPQMMFVLAGPPCGDAQKAWSCARCAGFVFPSLTEGFGLPPIDALHFGKPVFLSQLSGLPKCGWRRCCKCCGMTIRRTHSEPGPQMTQRRQPLSLVVGQVAGLEFVCRDECCTAQWNGCTIHPAKRSGFGLSPPQRPVLPL